MLGKNDNNCFDIQADTGYGTCFWQHDDNLNSDYKTIFGICGKSKTSHNGQILDTFSTHFCNKQEDTDLQEALIYLQSTMFFWGYLKSQVFCNCLLLYNLPLLCVPYTIWIFNWIKNWTVPVSFYWCRTSNDVSQIWNILYKQKNLRMLYYLV